MVVMAAQGKTSLFKKGVCYGEEGVRGVPYTEADD